MSSLQSSAPTLSDSSKLCLFPQVVFLYHQEEAFTHQDSAPAVLLAFALYSWASVPLVYLSSFCFHYEGGAFVKLIIILTFLSLGPLILVSITSEKGEDCPSYTHLSCFRSQPCKAHPLP